jgi:hypothetical protein
MFRSTHPIQCLCQFLVQLHAECLPVEDMHLRANVTVLLSDMSLEGHQIFGSQTRRFQETVCERVAELCDVPR